MRRPRSASPLPGRFALCVIPFFAGVGFMRKHFFLLAALLFLCGGVLSAQDYMYKIDLIPSGAMIAMSQPMLQGSSYVFRSWPDGATSAVPQSMIRNITRLTGNRENLVVYRVDLNPSGMVLARENPEVRGSTYVFHTWRDNTLISVRAADVKGVTTLTGDQAFWAEQAQLGEKKIGTLAMQGNAHVVALDTPTNTNSSQAGPTSTSTLNGAGISGAPAYGNWMYQGTPGVSDAWSPANAVMNNGVPTMPGATNGMNPPR